MRKYYPKPTTLKSAIKGKVKDTAKKSLSMGNKNYPRKIVSDAKKTVKKDFPELYDRAVTGMKKGGSTVKEVEAEYRKNLPREMKASKSIPGNPKDIKKAVRKVTLGMKKGGFLSTGDDRRDLNIIRTAKNLDDGPASSTSSTTSSSSSNGMKAGGMVKMMKKGGKSTVNKAGNYTKPTMRKALFNRIKAGGKGGRPGQWSARKAQMLAKQYKAKGGGYRG